MPWKRPSGKFGTFQGYPNVWGDFCGNLNARGRMSTRQTRHMTGQMGRVHRTDGTHAHTTHTHL